MTTAEWKNCVQQYEKLIFTVCFQLVRDYQLAQDLTQETFFSAYTHRESCRLETVKPWLARIATNKAKDYLKSAYHRRVQTELEEEKADDEALPEKLLVSQEGHKKLTEYIVAMQEPYGKVARLYFLEEKSMNEIALLLQRPKKTVQTQIYRAKKILQSKVKEDGLYDII